MCCRGISPSSPRRCGRGLPLARSSEISRSLSFCDMDRYSAVTDMRFDWRTDRASWDDSVFCRETGWKDPEEDVEAREALDAGWSIVATDIGYQTSVEWGIFKGSIERNEKKRKSGRRREMARARSRVSQCVLFTRNLHLRVREGRTADGRSDTAKGDLVSEHQRPEQRESCTETTQCSRRVGATSPSHAHGASTTLTSPRRKEEQQTRYNNQWCVRETRKNQRVRLKLGRGTTGRTKRLSVPLSPETMRAGGRKGRSHPGEPQTKEGIESAATRRAGRRREGEPSRGGPSRRGPGRRAARAKKKDADGKREKEQKDGIMDWTAGEGEEMQPDGGG